MELTRAYKFMIYPDANRQKEIEMQLNLSKDFYNKLSDELVKSGYSFAVEALSIQNMEKNHSLAQAIQNASLNRFTQMLSYKAESAGIIVKVDARNTSNECSRCGNIQEMPISEIIYICKRCGLQMDRDVNAAISMLKSRACPNLRSGRYLPMRSNRERKQCRGTENIAQRKPTCLRWEDVT
ncbi:MAG: transposase [Conexivisphaerales archaeon]